VNIPSAGDDVPRLFTARSASGKTSDLDLVGLDRAHDDLVRSVRLVATGGDLQIGALIADRGVDGPIFLAGPARPDPSIRPRIRSRLTLAPPEPHDRYAV
jgi:methylglyoxal synthase